ncbi:MAG: hypothetical protein F6J96_07825 [Symploca sp. SIO1C2]|nr:hypothetical protein [Symploca sp. SIO1C2]
MRLTSLRDAWQFSCRRLYADAVGNRKLLDHAYRAHQSHTSYSPEKRFPGSEELRVSDWFLIFFFDVEFYPIPCIVKRS